MAAINTVPKSIHLPLTSLSTPRVLMCSASVGTEGSVTLQLRDADRAAGIAASHTNGVTATSASASATTSALENALTIGYPDPEMLADVLGTIQTASLKNNHNNSSITAATATLSNTTATVATATTTTSNHLGGNPNKITITRRNTNASSSSTASNGSSSSVSNKITVQTITTSTVSTNTGSSSGKSNTSYIKNCLIRSSSCSNTATNVTTLAQIMSNSSTSSAASLSLLNQHNNNSNCSNSSNFSNTSSTGSSVSVSSGSGSSNSNDSNSSGSHSLSFKSSNGKNVPGLITTATVATNTVAAAATASGVGVGVSVSVGIGVGIGAQKKSRPKLSSPTRHGPQQCQICSKIFGNASALAKHKLTHSDERKYICALCSKAFKRQDHLNGHMMTHRNKKPYECKAEGCGKSYCDARSLRRHTENHHGGALTPTNQSLSPTAHSSGGSSSGSSSGNSIVGTNTLSLSPATASGDASSPDGATCIRTYISTGGTVVDAATGIALSEEQIKAMNLPIKTGMALLSPTTSTSSNGSSTASSSSSSGCNTVQLASCSPTITLSDGATLEGEGLTREQLDLISKIMQQTKQTSAQVTVSSPTSVNSYKINTESCPSRPRTWNMQLLNNSQNVTLTVEDGAELVASSSCSPIDVKEDELSQQLVAAINPHLLNIVKVDKPVECNLCHRKFKNIPALNGHMRLHGGYFKKDPETKRNEKKDSSGPPLQTASIGVRALIEEKIISKRKDMSKGAFVVPAPPGSVASNTTTIRRSISDLENFLNPKSNSTSIGQTVSTGSIAATAAVLPAATTIKNSNGLSIQQIGLPQSIEIFSGGQKQSKTLSLGSGANTITITTNNVPTMATMGSLAALAGNSGGAGGGQKCSSAVDPKDSTLIELLKRGTRIAVTAKKTQQSQHHLLMSSSGCGAEIATITTTQAGRQIITNNNRTVIIPSDVQVVSTKSRLSSIGSIGSIGSSGSLASIGSSGSLASIGNTVSMNMTRAPTPASLSLPDGTPLSLTIAPSHESNGSSGGNVGNVGVGDIYTVTYTSDTSDLFDDTEVYNVSDTEMLLQTVDTMELLNDEEGAHIKTEHSEDYALVNDVGDGAHAHLVKIEPEQNSSTTTALPTFQQFHSKELIMQNSSQIQAIANMRGSTLSLPNLTADLKQQLGVLSSPLNSPLAYPTPPSSHENVAQSSPFIEDAAAQFVDASHTFFSDKTDFSHVYFKTSEDETEQQLTDNDNEKILKLKSVLEESSFDASIKVEDLLNSGEDDAECDLREFAETNLSFLDEDQEFLNDSRNATSPLSESFFTSGIGSAEDVKQVLREVLPEENMQLSSEQQGENIIDLYYLPGLGLQSQMMPNSEDPLLSSSPREFGQQRQPPQQQQQMPQPATMEQVQPPIYQQPLLLQQSENGNGDQQQQQQQQLQSQPQQVEFMLPLVASGGEGVAVAASNTMQFSVVQNQTQFLDHNQQQPMVLQPLNNMLQPLLYGNVSVDSSSNADSNINIDKQELHLKIATNAGQQPLLDTNMFYNGQSKPLLATVLSTAPIVAVANLQPLSNQTNSILKRRLRPNGSQDAQNFSKFQTLSPHRSKLRKPSRTHYTPAPILNPDRKGTGLYCSVREQLGHGLFDVFDDDFGDPVGLVDFSDESKVNLGSAYQAQIPLFCKTENFDKLDAVAEAEPLGAELMWDPSVQLDEKILMRYIDLSKSSAVPMGSHSEEVALQTLLKAKGNSAAAVLSLLQTQSGGFQMKWTARELELFLRGLERNGKDFAKIARELRTKSSGDCVQMYYFWKKLCVDYKVSHLKMEPVAPTTPPVEPKPYVCEIPDCSASFSSKAALHGHVRIHAYGRNANNNNQHATTNSSNANNSNSNNNNSSIVLNCSYACAPLSCNGNHNNNSNLIQANNAPTHAISNNNNSSSSNNANNSNGSNNNAANNSSTANNLNKEPPNNSNNAKDGEFPCKVCGKVFNKVKSRSAHMKTHRVQESEQSLNLKQQQATQTAAMAAAASAAAAAAAAVAASASAPS